MGTVPVSLSKERLGLDLHMYDGPGPVTSDTWSFGGWKLYFVRLDGGQKVALGKEGTTYVKVVTGALSSPARLPYIEARSLTDTRVTESELVAGAEGALVTVLIKTASA
ncbi:MAG: hypothetical protein ACKOYL_08410, partial [Actinomycetota bacterium]